MSTGKIIIAGAGRAGTSFLVRLLTRLGVDTGYTPDADGYDPKVRAGCEITAGMVFDTDATTALDALERMPRVLKSPDWSFYLDQFLGIGLKVDYVLVPVRNAEDAARSRLNAGLPWRIDPSGPDPFAQQVVVCNAAVGAIISTCESRDIPYLILNYPALVNQPDYLYRKLRIVFPYFHKTVESGEFMRVYQTFTDAFEELIRVHQQ